MVLTVHAYLVCQYSGRDNLFQTEGTGNIQRNFLADVYDQFPCSVVNINEKGLQEKLFNYYIYVIADHIWPLAGFLPDGISRPVAQRSTNDDMGFWCGIRFCRIDHVCYWQSFKQSSVAGKESSFFKRKCDTSYIEFERV